MQGLSFYATVASVNCRLSFSPLFLRQSGKLALRWRLEPAAIDKRASCEIIVVADSIKAVYSLQVKKESQKGENSI
jgi:hypothetical protein